MRSTIFLIASALTLSACHKAPPPQAAPQAAVVIRAGSAAGVNTLAYAGEVRSRYEADLAFRVAGKLLERRVNLGDTVRKGQVLARLDPADLGLSAKSAEAQLAAAEADLALAKADYERAQHLFAQKFLSVSAVDARRSQFDAAQARRQQALAAREVAQNQLGYAQLVAERDGVITAAPIEVGQVLAAGQLVLRIADPAQREVLVWIPESRVAGLKPGQVAQVQAWSAPDKLYSGVLRELAASADASTRTYAARISVTAPDEHLGLGSTAAAGFVLPIPAGANIELPLAAVIRGDGGKGRVWIVDEQDQVQPREVEVAAWGDEKVRLTGGVKPGERVVTVGAHALSAGLKVRPVEQGAPVVLDVKR
ncbi:efflux RND transporter periplasmic adaptor subunit [Uliginosibacterium sp. TH139]|uniref:efflux RND transporter periplasmic adaptor subunit n=1 Tax=Uliginosibacterium sp. TH139 TaxID=2067453 RepID=UPI000C7B9474|nr:efflux RND transporter periplasmic adaptor subunit [Uliginosibacterium sp. TH139]PLK49152.1 efflux transporter periplasmic adaptor subunit [Uliginosibacterium sp. TH139]